jgi:hypothetical protein
MASWHEVQESAEGLALRVQNRFELDGHAMLATLRRDGSPRLSGIEITFALGELWLGMMPDSLKVFDLLRDPRCSLHTITHGKDVADGDGKLNAVAARETDPVVLDALAVAMGGIPETGMVAFRMDVTEMSFLEGAGDHLAISSWRDGGPVADRKRY